MQSKFANTTIAITSICGALFLFIGTYLHPMGADPNDALAAFTEYANDHHWVASHLVQLLGVVFMISSLIVLSTLFSNPSALVLGKIGTGWAISVLALAGALQAVDGIALKAMVNAWASAETTEQASLFHATLGVRQIEIGLASITSLVTGLTMLLFGFALLFDSIFPKWVGFLALLSGVPTCVAGIVIGYTGFSELSMIINMPASFLLLIWMFCIGILSWKRST
ncbi:putative membrane protein [Leptospira fainei serovar Hurstbridge str. BUT 6]|uniref:Membrane protein n=1 Tax=Leptospira fainei serovar Hurstbridge str. BUT 6 TaxID=1193011 RepID=S3VAT1_9LEPT|nr:membrane protein [Leptospira fainei]EPG73535.1 putative membrane protein [Leptospira fainei serovar Hurstbridge str. BUT 6]